MKLNFLLNFVLFVQCVKLNLNKYTNLVNAVNEVIINCYSNQAFETNLISTENQNMFATRDFQDELLMRSFAGFKVAIRQEIETRIKALPGRRRYFSILGVETFDEFLQMYKNLSPEHFWLNGFYLIVLVNGEISEIEDIFRLLWKLQIFNANIIYESGEAVLMKTFLPMKAGNCNDTRPILINSFRNGKFINGTRKLFPKKLNNLYNCSIRVVVAKNSEPYAFIKTFKNGTLQLSGQDISVVRVLSEILNFRINFTIADAKGSLFDNGTADGVLKVLIDGKADLAISNLGLKPNRFKFLASTTPYASEEIVFLIPPGENFTMFEAIIYPFSASLWILILLCFFIGYFVIFIMTLQSEEKQKFVFGIAKAPYLNMFVGFIGGVQSQLPRTNFARFILMMFLIQSLVIRTIYQGSYFKLLQSNKHHREVQSIEEMIQKDFKFYGVSENIDLLKGTEIARSRLKIKIELLADHRHHLSILSGP